MKTPKVLKLVDMQRFSVYLFILVNKSIGSQPVNIIFGRRPKDLHHWMKNLLENDCNVAKWQSQ